MSGPATPQPTSPPFPEPDNAALNELMAIDLQYLNATTPLDADAWVEADYEDA